MKEEKSIIKIKYFQFAVRIVKLYQYLIENKKEFVLSKQLLRSGTSVGANVREAHNGESEADFIHKLSMAQKETDETLYWLELLKETNYLTDLEYDSIYNDGLGILKIIRSIILKMKQKRTNLKDMKS